MNKLQVIINISILQNRAKEVTTASTIAFTCMIGSSTYNGMRHRTPPQEEVEEKQVSG